MTSRVSQVTIDARDVSAVSTFWSAALGYRVDQGDDGSAKLYPPESAGPDVVTIWVQAVTEGKHGKNPVHLDLNATAGDDAADTEVERLLTLDATRADVGQRLERRDRRGAGRHAPRDQRAATDQEVPAGRGVPGLRLVLLDEAGGADAAGALGSRVEGGG